MHRSFRTPAFAARLAALACALFAFAAERRCRADEGTLGDLRSAARTESAYASASSGSSDSGSSHDRDDCDEHDDGRHFGCGGCDCGNLLASAAAIVITSPFWGPMALMQDDWRDRCTFEPYPYFDGRTGGELIDEFADSRATRAWGGRFLADYADDFSGVQGVGGRLLLQHAWRWGLDSEFVYRAESLSGSRSDEFWNGDANVVYRFAECDWGQMRAGGGLNWLADPGGTDLGGNFTYGGDFYPARPFVISADLDFGTLSEAWQTHFRTTFGVVWRGLEVFAGYDVYRLDAASVDGFVTGVRAWF